MPSSKAGIQPLPRDVAAKIKSSTSITHLNGVIIELVKNALDANAHTVCVTVDFRRGSCIVEDDGDGIQAAEFEPSGGLGKAHHTSRLCVPGAYGQRGQFIASLASLSLLTITSRHVHQQTTSSVLFHQSRAVARLVPAPAHQSFQFADHGTCVSVNNLFGNMPVRVKSRASTLEKPDELEREWDSLRYALVSLMLANSQLRKLIISDKKRGRRISVRLGLTGNGLSVTDGVDEVNLMRIGSILAQSGMMTARNLDSWHVVSATLPDLTIRAAISTVPNPTKKLQFISLGDDPILSRGNSNVLFHEINQLVASSDFGNVAVKSEDTLPTRTSERSGFDGVESATARAWAKPVCKWPMFYIRIDTSSDRTSSVAGDEISPDSEKSLQRITDVLGVLVVEFLRQQNMRPRLTRRQGKMFDRGQQTTTCTTSQRSAGESVNRLGRDGDGRTTEEAFGSQLKLPSFQRSRSTTSGQSFTNWSRVKAAKDLEHLQAPIHRTPAAASEPGKSKEREPRSSVRDWPSRNLQKTAQSTQLSQTHDEPILWTQGSHPGRGAGDSTTTLTDENLISWTDPRTAKTHMINSRTGQTVDGKTSDTGLRIWPGSLSGASGHIGHVQNPPITSSSAWVDDLLTSWDNPTFNRTEKQVASLDIGSNHWNTNDTRGCLHDIGTLGSTQVAKFRGRLQRYSLATSRIIAQIDCKFILVKVRAASGQLDDNEPESALVLVDQHAADERCRVEQLFEEMFVPAETPHGVTQVRILEIDPLSFSVSVTEGTLFQKYLCFFAKWGIWYEVVTETDSGVIVSVKTLPLLIAERCRLEPNVLINLLRREIWTSEEDDGSLLKKTPKPQISSNNPALLDENQSLLAATSGTAGSAHSWIQQMSGCPQGILDLLNSRACRGAIMFNDPLNIEECHALVSRLAQCAFPFQCAHGRPSMVPILDLRQRASDDDSSAFDAGALPPDVIDEHNDLDLDVLQALRAQYVK